MRKSARAAPAGWAGPRLRERFTRVVEQATGRKVIGFMSGNQQDPDMICEVFVLAQNTLLE
jgi:hypothetical protein